MVSTIDMQDMRYLNLFERVTRISTRYCFKYNETIFFCVPQKMVSKAVGERGINMRTLNEILHTKTKVIALPRGVQDVEEFVHSIVSPVIFKGIDVKENEIILGASTQSKAALIGRNKKRLQEMQKIISDYFGKEFRIV